MRSRSIHRRRGLTLIELVVVLVVLVALAGMVLPMMSGIGSQANYATDTSIVSDIDKAVRMYENRNPTAASSPNGWDGILTSSSGGFYPKLHPNLQTSVASASAMLPILTTTALSANQLASLNAAGITGLHYNTDTNNATGMPSDSGVAYEALAGPTTGTTSGNTSGSMVASLFIPTTTSSPAWTGHGSTFPDRAFNLNPFNFGATDTFVVFGVGQPCTMRGVSLQDSPIVQSANPNLYYARPLVVYRIPVAAGAASPAKYVGSFLPDGTCLSDNVRKFNAGSN